MSYELGVRSCELGVRSWELGVIPILYEAALNYFILGRDNRYL